MGAKYTEAQAKATRKYLDKTVSIQIRVSQEKRELIKSKADEQGKSLSGYIISLIDKEFE